MPTATGTTHLAATDKGAKPKEDRKQSSYRKICFKCDEEGHLAKECPNNKKKDGSPLNSNEEINKKFDKIKNRTTKEPEPEERDDSEKKLGAGTAMFILLEAK